MSNKKSGRAGSIPGYIYALDGLRAVSIILIFIFHSWQQSWIFFQIPLKNGKYLLNLTLFQRYGYIALDAFFVLSGFCLFYPIARAMFGESKQIGWKEFYIKRIRRIIPGYWLMLILLLIFPALSYHPFDMSSATEMLKQYGLHALCLHIYNKSTTMTVIGTAWTLGIEVAFYVFFPLIVKPFKKHPVISLIVMFIIGQGTRLFSAFFLMDTSNTYQAIPLAYTDIFGLGMMCAYLVVKCRHKLDMSRLKWFMTALSVVCLVGVYYFTKWMNLNTVNGLDASVYFRWFFRIILSAIFAVFIFATAYSIDLWSRRVWGNRFFVYISTISYSFFLWHQNMNIFFKQIGVPYTTSDPVMNDRAAMDGYVFLTIITSLAIATASTYLIEMPIAKYGFVGYFKRIASGIKTAPEKIKTALKNA